MVIVVVCSESAQIWENGISSAVKFCMDDTRNCVRGNAKRVCESAMGKALLFEEEEE